MERWSLKVNIYFDQIRNLLAPDGGNIAALELRHFVFWLPVRLVLCGVPETFRLRLVRVKVFVEVFQVGFLVLFRFFISESDFFATFSFVPETGKPVVRLKDLGSVLVERRWVLGLERSLTADTADRRWGNFPRDFAAVFPVFPRGGREEIRAALVRASPSSEISFRMVRVWLLRWNEVFCFVFLDLCFRASALFVERSAGPWYFRTWEEPT